MMASVQKLNGEYQASGVVEVSVEALAESVSRQLLHDACVMYAANRRVGTVRTKSRAEVAGSSKKMYRQKGTGRARAGNRRTPVRVGGGHCFAKRPKDWSYSLPRKALQIATRMALRVKIESGDVLLVDDVRIPEAKTRHVVGVLRNAGVVGGSCLIVTGARCPDLVMGARNIPNLSVSVSADLNADLLLRHKRVLMTADALKYHLDR